MTGIASPIAEHNSLGGVGAGVRITPAFRLGLADLDVAEHVKKIPGLRNHKLERVRILLDEVMTRYAQTDAAASDAWLGPRLHAALRLSRREAGNRDLWRFMGLWGADYVRWRFGPSPGEHDLDKAAKEERFVGPDSKQAFARLWWMAEVFRDGKTYTTAALALTNQDIVNNLFRMSICNHRPTALAVLQASADGHTLFFTNSQLSISAAMREPLPYDALRDFTGLALVAEAPSLVVVTPGLGVRSLQEFLALAREKPGAIHFGGGAVGTATHMAGAYFAHRAGIRLTHVPYKEANVVGDLVTGRIQAMFVPIPFLQAQIRDGKLVALAVTSPAGLSRPFKVPAAADSGLPGYEYQTWYGIVAPREVPAAVLDRLLVGERQVAREPELGERLLAQGMSPRAITTGEFDAYIRADVERLAPVVKASTDK